MTSIWGRDPIYIAQQEEREMTNVNMGLVVEAEMVVTHADGTTDADDEPTPAEPVETKEGE